MALSLSPRRQPRARRQPAADRQLELIPGGARDRRARQTIRVKEEIGNGKGVNICQITTK